MRNFHSYFSCGETWLDVHSQIDFFNGLYRNVLYFFDNMNQSD